MDKLETMLDEWFVKKAPFQLPENARKGLVTALPWVALVLGILQLFAALGLWGFIGAASVALYGAGLGVAATTWMPIIWLSLAIVLVEAVMLLVAFPKLKDNKKSGWKIMLWIAFLNLAYAVVSLFGMQGFPSFIMNVLAVAIGMYLLFQIRSHYSENGTPTVKSAAKK